MKQTLKYNQHTRQRRRIESMADSTSPNNTPTINSLPEFTSDVYANITPAELAVFAVYTLTSDGHFAAIEEIVSACFRLFPHRFSLKNYFYWPDSAQIVLYLNEAKEKGDLKGKSADGFAVKVQGRQTVKRVAKILGVILPVPEKKIQKPAPAKEVKAEPVPPAQPEAEKKVKAPRATKPVLKKKPAKKKVIAPQKAKPANPVTKKVPAKKQAVVSRKEKSAAPVAIQKPVKKKTVVPQEAKPIKPLVAKKPVKKQAVVKSVVPVVKEKPVKKKAAVIQEKQPIKQKPAKKKAKPVKAKTLPKPVVVKQATLLHVKVEAPKKKEQAKPVAPVAVTKVIAQRKGKPQKQAPIKSAQPAQLTMSLLPAVQEKKEKPAPTVVKKAEPKPVKVEMVIAPVAAIQVSKEEQAKAGKVVHLMERSDAYRQYKKSGDKSRISEFDFRSLLLCTMESSPETLARNVNTFKGYANIQNRQDLVVFLNFVESSFSGLLNSSGKKLAKKK